MNAWILVVTLASGEIIGAPFETEKECKKHLADVITVMTGTKGSPFIRDAQCSLGEITPEEHKATEPTDL